MSSAAILFDTEFTTWEGAMASNWSEPWQHRELVQVAAMKIDIQTLEEIERFNVVVKPQKNPDVSDYFVDLTGITNEFVNENGVSFEEMHAKFEDFVKDAKAWSFGNDGGVFEENYDLYDLGQLQGRIDFQNLHRFFQQQGVDVKAINSGKLASYFGLNIEIHEHNAMDDVRSIHAALTHLKAQGQGTPFIA